jgi:hypothetical protein
LRNPVVLLDDEQRAVREFKNLAAADRALGLCRKTTGNIVKGKVSSKHPFWNKLRFKRDGEIVFEEGAADGSNGTTPEGSVKQVLLTTHKYV